MAFEAIMSASSITPACGEVYGAAPRRPRVVGAPSLPVRIGDRI